MNNPLQDERRPQTSTMIQELLAERKQVWALYCELGGMKPFAPGRTVDRKIQEFCQILIDYISLGHFGVYRRIIDGTERRRKAIDAAQQVYPAIEEVTDTALQFNDKYAQPEAQAVYLELEKDLSQLGEALATRFDLEDQLMASLLA
ncbi:MAG: Rsd/AlgQ family anti-sigma factor [Methylotetracoccus sp.]